MLRRLTVNTAFKLLAIPVVLLIVVGLLLVSRGGGGTRTVTAHFSQAVSVFKGTEVSIMGVKVGQVTQVVPEGDSVKVVMTYDDDYHLPADVKAAVVTPTLVADRFVQLAPAYTDGPTMADGGDIPMSRTQVPLELDEIYKTLADLTEALGPNGANRKGALSDVLRAGAKSLKGNGRLGNQMIAQLSDAAQTLDTSSPELFSTLDSLAGITTTLDRNDRTVQQFLKRLAKVSKQLAGERGDLSRALAAIADAVETTRGFVKDNKGAVVGDLKKLNETLQVLADQKDTLGTVLQLAPLGLGNLAESFDTRSGTEGIRLQVGPTGSDLSNILCAMVVNDKIPNAQAACGLFKALVPNKVTSALGSALTGAGVPTQQLGGTDLRSLTDRVQDLAGGDR